MITISQATQKIVNRLPFFEGALSEGLINLSALARKIKPEIDAMLLKDVSEGAIIMALKRFAEKSQGKDLFSAKLKTFGGSLSVRSNLVEYTFTNSSTLFNVQRHLLKVSGKQADDFVNVSQGFKETTFIISKSLQPVLEGLTKQEERVFFMDKLAGVTIHFTEDTIHTPGIYCRVLKSLAWENINLIEMISVAAELTIIFKDQDVDEAFRVIKSITT